jgi:hypothetical protein
VLVISYISGTNVEKLVERGRIAAVNKENQALRDKYKKSKKCLKT